RNVEATASDYSLSYPVAIDEHLTVFERLGVVAVPSIVLTDFKRTVVGLLDGYSNMTRGDFHEKVLEALGVKPSGAERETVHSSGYTPKGKSVRYYQMGEIFWRKGLRQKAAESFARAVAEDPNYREACMALTRALEDVGRFKNSKWTDLYVANLQDSCPVGVTDSASSP
ncbi:MAG TPA: thioredoxin family protein, partial [Deferrisomatales bacterium]|nr:thioredoxin family protein [Deferrisomatales bacterium]